MIMTNGSPANQCYRAFMMPSTQRLLGRCEEECGVALPWLFVTAKSIINLIKYITLYIIILILNHGFRHHIINITTINQALNQYNNN